MSVVGRVGAFALLLSVAACSAAERPPAVPVAVEATESSAPVSGPASAPASASASASGSAPASAPAKPGTPDGPGPLPRGDRQVVFATVASGGTRVLSVGADGLVELAGRESERALFVATPNRPGSEKFMIKTGKLRTGGETWCLKVHSPGGSEPLRLRTDACDAGDRDQIFTLPAAQNEPGRYLEVAGLFALATPDDGQVVVQESGEGDAMSSFAVVDRGRASIPALD
ncbi:hypothetical protein AB0M02_04345 [Actinoplanes sp. NPDC051861]|uniref:hypothetical protein n=1 Tax=Actinoplanes sp. NPDC051861 TaxID=3155170 RepID=UPI00341EE214